MLDSFSSGIQLYVRLSPHSCFIFFLYLDLDVLGDDYSIRKGSIMRTKHLCALTHIRIKGEVGTIKNV